ncbi:DNA-methyltransferase [Heliophilum fasciatum]|uniref:Methyltransferase n=1 Tax=Heliophilum fasciatum TaxID=35700 RepID=A0A4R2RMJ0_9FIRM|nr:DNA methyltransferase [Heliophilum fasciatum]MCW2278007.1 site-specific DNA-methyltransferase (adenine-specific) [Heliophilum fasciatum]TCP64373.1 site-specific DNA-methyltransferase (adenine-specific) [Heliophilum fasciatum]
MAKRNTPSEPLARTHPLMRNSNAPMNRTLFLEPEDWERYAQLPTVDTLRAHGPVDNTIYVGDALEGLRLLPDASVDLVFADPPYFGLKKDFGYGTRKNPWKTLEDYMTWADAWIREARRVLLPHGAIYLCCGWESSGAMQTLLSHHFIVKNRLTWRREKGRGAARNWKNNMEDIWYAVVDEEAYLFHLNDVKIKKEIIAPYTNAEGQPKDWVETDEGERFRMTCPPNIWIDLTVPFWSMPENTPHPTQKPEKLVERCLLASSNPGGVVVDPFMGSGTTAAVAARLGRRFLGFEVYDDYVRLTLKRLER